MDNDEHDHGMTRCGNCGEWTDMDYCSNACFEEAEQNREAVSMREIAELEAMWRE